MKPIQISIFVFFAISNVMPLELFDHLAALKNSRRKNHVRLEQADVYNGVKRILRSIFPEDEMNRDEDNNEGGKSEECLDCEEEQPYKPETENHSHSGHQKPVKKPSGKNQKGSKYTNVNFVLYNSGIKFNKADDAYNKKQIAKLGFNCVLVVASENKCYGWDTKKNGTKSSANGGDKGMTEIEKFLPEILPLLMTNSSNALGLDKLMHSPPDGDNIDADGNELSPTFRRYTFKDIIDDEEEDTPDHFTIYI